MAGADGVEKLEDVIVRTAEPQVGATARVLKGLYGGIDDVGVPAVGVETSRDTVSSVKVFQQAVLSTVDDVETQIGKLALVALLSDPSVAGDYGMKKTAHDGPLPDIAPLPATAGG